MDDTARDFHVLGREHLEQPPDFEQRIFDQLLAERPHLHGRGSVHDWGLSQRTVSYLYKTVRPGWKTLEVGAGLSTIVFALKGADHIAISPVPEEHGRIEQWCRSHGLAFLAADTSPAAKPGAAGDAFGGVTCRRSPHPARR